MRKGPKSAFKGVVIYPLSEMDPHGATELRTRVRSSNQVIWGVSEGGCNGKGYPERTNFHDAPCFRNSRLKLAVFCVLLSAPDPKCALTPSDPKIRAGKFNIFALTRAVLRTLKNHIRPAP